MMRVIVLLVLLSACAAPQGQPGGVGTLGGPERGTWGDVGAALVQLGAGVVPLLRLIP